MLTLLLGGARSGKSALALELARRHDGRVTYLATSPRIAGDAELEERIERHREERPAVWATVEEEIDLAGALTGIDPTSFVIVDCCTTWIGNLLHHGDHATAEIDAIDAIDATLASIARRSAPTVVISNEVGLGVVPATPLGREYRDLLGRINQRVARQADRTLLLVAGLAVELRDPWDLIG